MYISPRFGSYGVKLRTGPNNALDSDFLGALASAGLAASGSALRTTSGSAAPDSTAAGEVEAFFFELAGLATTFRFEAGFAFFAVDFSTVAFFLPARFAEIFFEVPFFPDDVFVVVRALSDDPPAFGLRLTGVFRDVFPAAVLLPVFFFFLVAAFLPGIQIASKSNYTKPAIIHTGWRSGSPFVSVYRSPL